MTALIRIIKSEIYDLTRSKWLVLYGAFFWGIVDLLWRFGSNGTQVIVSLMNIVLYIVPLLILVFCVMYIYNLREYIQLLLTQPIDRKIIYIAIYIGLALPLCAVFLIGLGMPLIYIQLDPASHSAFISLLVSGLALTLIFSSLAYLFTTIFEDRIKGLGAALFVWLTSTIFYDALVLFILFAFSDYPLNNTTTILSLLNPIDLARIFLLLKLDISALMGYTGASFSEFFGNSLGAGISVLAMLVWFLFRY